MAAAASTTAAGSIAAEPMAIAPEPTAITAESIAAYGGWARPAYGWGPGGAIAAGAALGVLATGAAIAYAGQPPAPGLCWYYTDPSYRQGFWDACQ